MAQVLVGQLGREHHVSICYGKERKRSGEGRRPRRERGELRRGLVEGGEGNIGCIARKGG